MDRFLSGLSSPDPKNLDITRYLKISGMCPGWFFRVQLYSNTCKTPIIFGYVTGLDVLKKWEWIGLGI